MTQTYFDILLLLHILGGTVGLLSGILVFSLKKGTRIHAILGKIFIPGMLLAGTTSLFMAVIHPNTFLFMVGIFTIYLVGTGARTISSKNQKANQLIDRLLQFGMVVSGLSLGYLGTKGMIGGNNFGMVYIVFASIGLLMVFQDFKSSRGQQQDKKAYVRKHLQRLGGGFIASATAFLVVNFRELPEWLPVWVLWLLPTILISPLISLHSKNHTPKPKTP